MTLREARHRKGFSLGELADLAGCTQPYLSMLERGERQPESISYKLAITISRALDVDPQQLFGPQSSKRARKVA